MRMNKRMRNVLLSCESLVHVCASLCVYLRPRLCDSDPNLSAFLPSSLSIAMDRAKRMKLVKPTSELAEQIVGLLDQSLIPMQDTPSPSARSMPHSSARFNEGESIKLY